MIIRYVWRGYNKLQVSNNIVALFFFSTIQHTVTASPSYQKKSKKH